MTPLTLRQSLLEHYILLPEKAKYVKVNQIVTTDFDQMVMFGDIIEVDWPGVGITQWVVGEYYT